MHIDIDRIERRPGGPGAALVRVTGRTGDPDSGGLVIRSGDRAFALVEVDPESLPPVADGPPITASVVVPEALIEALGGAPLRDEVLTAAAEALVGAGEQLARMRQLASRVERLERLVPEPHKVAVRPPRPLRQPLAVDVATLVHLSDAILGPDAGAVGAPREHRYAGPQQPAGAEESPSGQGRRRTAATALGLIGALLVADGVLTLTWQEPISHFYNAGKQEKLAGQLEKVQRRVVTRPPVAAADPEQAGRAFAGAVGDLSANGGPIGRLKIPSIDLDHVVAEGTGTAALRGGPGHYRGTSLPGEPGVVGIAGHRTTYGAPFRRLDELKVGRKITLTMPYGTFRYRVDRVRVTDSGDVRALRSKTADGRLVLTTCHPLDSSRQRLVVIASEVDSKLELRGLTQEPRQA